MALPGHAQQSKASIQTRGLAQGDATIHTTLLELVRTIGEITENEAEIVATVLQMLRSGSVKLTGSFRDEPIRFFSD